jgi:hypothetical protein
MIRTKTLSGPYINDKGYEVPNNKILVVPHGVNSKTYFEEVLEPLKGVAKRDWFSSHAYYCLPLTVANQYGFLIKSVRDFEIVWPGGESEVIIRFLNEDNAEKQIIKNGFGLGIVTVQNRFALKTPLGVNIMTIQPPNMFIPACFSLTGIIECDNIRRDFTFNFKVTVPDLKITVKKGDPLGAFIPIQRYFVDEFEVEAVENYFSDDLVRKEIEESQVLAVERNTSDKEKPHSSGRRYFKGVHTDGSKYPDHQKQVK